MRCLTRDVPNVSTLAKRRGKMGKSTARIAMQVMIIILALYTDRNVLCLLLCVISFTGVVSVGVKYNAVLAVSSARFTNST